VGEQGEPSERIEPSERTRSVPSRAWYAVALLPFLLSLIPAYLLGRAAADEVDVHLEQLTEATIELNGDDRSIYATSRELSEQARCRLRSATGAAVRLDRSESHASTEQDETTWFRVASIPSDVDDGTYALRCRADGERVEPTSFALSSPPRWGRFALLMIAAFGIPVAAAVLGTLIFVAVLAMRRRADRPDGEPGSFSLQLDE
jgi:hypothetical protein